MTFAVGIFDLLTYAIPGSLYLGLLTVIASRPDLLSLQAATDIPGWLLVIIVVVASYLLGYLTYPLGAIMNRLVPTRRVRDPRGEFLTRAAADESATTYVQTDPFLLLAALQLHNRAAADEVTRVRAAGLMLRNSAPPLFLVFPAAIIELIAGQSQIAAVLVAALSLLTSLALITQARRLGYWASLKTLELCYWLPDLDRLRHDPDAHHRR